MFRDLNPDVMKRLYEKSIRYSVMELPFFGFIDKLPEFARDGTSTILRSIVR